MQEITISLERFQQLVRAEQDANFLKNLLAVKYNNFGIVDRDEVKLLCKIYFGDSEE